MFGGQNLNPATFKYKWKGDWKPHICFNRNDVVRHKGRSWYCNTDALFRTQSKGYNHEPGRGSEWNAYSYNTVNRGGWGPHRDYHEGDVVCYKGEWYVCRIGGRGINPVYENGSTTSKWTKVIPSSRVNNTDKFLPQNPNGNPIGCNLHRCSCQTITGNPSYGAWLFDWEGNVRHYGALTGASNGGIHDGAGYTSRLTTNYRTHDNTGVIPSIQDLDIIEHNKTPITGKLECLQFFSGYTYSFHLMNNGGLYACGTNAAMSLGMGDNTTEIRGQLLKVGMISDTQLWTDSITDTIRDAFIVKIAQCVSSSTGLTNRSPIALDSDGFVWTWGETQYGQTGTGYSSATPDYTADIGIPKKLPRAAFGGNTIVDIFRVEGSNVNNDSFYAMDNNGVLWGWGYNGYGLLGSGDDNIQVRKPNPIIDCSKFGGLRKFCPGGGDTYPLVHLLMENGTVFFLGDMSHAGHLFGGTWVDVMGFTWHGPVEMAQFLYGNYRGDRRDLAQLIDFGSNIKDIFCTTSGSSINGPTYFKDNNNDIRVSSFAGTHSPLRRDQNFDGTRPTTTTRYTNYGDLASPVILDTTSLNGLVEHIAEFTGRVASQNHMGAVFLSEDGRLKVQRNSASSGGAKDNMGLGLTGSDGRGDQGTLGDAGQAFYRIDEYGNYDDNTPMSPRGNGMAMYGTTHVWGASGGTASGGAGDTSVYVTVSEDGTAGFYGQITAGNNTNEHGVIEVARNNVSDLDTRDDTQAAVGRIRAV